MTRGAPSGEVEWAKIAKSLALALRCGDCLRAYVLLDEEQREGGRPVRGVEAVAGPLGWQTRTAKKHLEHLATIGLIELDPMPAPGQGWGRVRFRVTHNPARGRTGEGVMMSPLRDIWEPDTPSRWRPEPNTKYMQTLREERQACADLPNRKTLGALRQASGVPIGTDAMHTAPTDEARRANGLSAPRQASTAHAARTAPSASSSRSEEEVLKGGRVGRSGSSRTPSGDSGLAVVRKIFPGAVDACRGYDKKRKVECGQPAVKTVNGLDYCASCKPF